MRYDGTVSPILSENMISKAGKPFNAQIQINAEKKGLEFKFDNTPRQSVTQHVNQEQQKGVSRKICGVELTERQQAALNEGRTEIKGVKLSEQQKTDLAMGKAVAVENMISKAGKPFNAQIQINADKKGIEFHIHINGFSYPVK